jgi:hypothetical protein
MALITNADPTKVFAVLWKRCAWEGDNGSSLMTSDYDELDRLYSIGATTESSPAESFTYILFVVCRVHKSFSVCV